MEGPLQRAAGLILRVGSGTLLFTLVLFTAQSSDPRIAGMMMAFPAVNGISLMLAPVASKRSMANAMLPVIAINGWMAIGFIAALGAIVNAAGDGAVRWIWPLATSALALWLAVMATLSKGPRLAERLLLRAFLLTSPFLILFWWKCFALDSGDLGGIVAEPAAYAWRVGLFAASLMLLLLVADYFAGGHAVLGRLGAFPLLPLFTLATLAHSGPTVQVGLGRLIAARPYILLGTLIAMAFALLYARFLDGMRRSPASISRPWLPDAGGLLIGWIICGAAILLISKSLMLIEHAITTLSCV